MIRTSVYYLREYIQKERSPADIAKEHDTYPNKIRREIQSFGYRLRDKSTAQKVAIKHGRNSHPTEGKTRSADERRKISASMAKAWDDMDDIERRRRTEIGKRQWAKMPKAKREEFKRLAAKAVRQASEEGSKLERFIATGLGTAGYNILFHIPTMLGKEEKVMVDILIPDMKVAIDVHGPTHFMPIWGEERLEKTEKEDAEKMKLFVSNGFVFFRVIHMAKTVSEVDKQVLLEVILAKLENIKNKFPKRGERLVQLEVN